MLALIERFQDEAPHESKQYVVFTDLDGTLLDHSSYSYDAALPALNLLKRLRIPIVFCSSKTAAEMTALQRQMGLDAPFIFENGGGIQFSRPSGKTIKLGTPVLELERQLEKMQRALKLRVTTLRAMTAEEFAAYSSLSLEEAQRAKEREFSLPFLPIDDANFRRLGEQAEKRGLKLTRGGRFFHLTGMVDKGVAVEHLMGLLADSWRTSICTLGLGDSRNDLEMLQRVSIPIIVPNPASVTPLTHELPGAVRATLPGPSGWNEVILDFFSSGRERAQFPPV